MSANAFPESWIVLHTRAETYDDDQLPTRFAIAATQSAAFDAMCAMACLTKEQRTEHALFHPAIDTMELATKLHELTGDTFEAMLAEEFLEKVERHALPGSLQIAPLTASAVKIEPIEPAARTGTKVTIVTRGSPAEPQALIGRNIFPVSVVAKVLAHDLYFGPSLREANEIVVDEELHRLLDTQDKITLQGWHKVFQNLGKIDES